jgi:hypothetical protein
MWGQGFDERRLVPAVSECAMDTAMAKRVRIYGRCKKTNRVVPAAGSNTMNSGIGLSTQLVV